MDFPSGQGDIDPRLSRRDLTYLIMTYAREESGFGEVVSSLSVWDFDEIDVLAILRELLGSKDIFIFEEVEGDEARKFDEIEARKAIERIFNEHEWLWPQVGLTHRGWERYQKGDFGLTPKRAQYLLFSDQANHRFR